MKYLLVLSVLLCLVPAQIPAVVGAEGTISDQKSVQPEQTAPVPPEKKAEKPRVFPCLTSVDAEVHQKAVLLCVHGLGLNSNSYSAFGKRMSKLGYLVYAVDVPGFGSFQEAGQGRDRVNFPYFLEGIVRLLGVIHKANRGLPVYILGESMGGAIALRVTAEYPALVDGLISSVPSGERYNQRKETMKVGLKLLTAPNKPFDIGTSVIERATADMPEAEKYQLIRDWEGDKLNRMELTPMELVKFQGFMKENFEAARKISSTPVLFVQGGKDKLVRPEGTFELFKAIATPEKQKQFELIDDKGHLIFEEDQFDDHVIDIVNNWLTAQIESARLTKK